MAGTESVEASLPAETTEQQVWQVSLRNAVRSGRELCRRLNIPVSSISADAERDFPVFVPLEYLAKMTPGRPDDPLLKQVLPSPEETALGGETDPVQDQASLVGPGLLQKYAGRVLVIATGACAVHCRYCFRRHFPYHTLGSSGPATWQQWVDILANNPSIDEVILSGGDPLVMTDQRLRQLIECIASVPTVKRLRLHTRFPVVIPSRITDTLLDVLTSTRLLSVIVFHFNHANELVDDVPPALQRARSAGIPLLNQAVLLRGVNDSVAAQVELCRSLVNIGVLPYYLHQLDPVQGALHFAVCDDRANHIAAGMARQLPGYAVPRLVREVPGAASKIAL